MGIKCISCFSVTFMLNISCSDIFSELYLRYTQKCMYAFIRDFKKISSMSFRQTDRQTEKHNQTKLVGNFFNPL